MTKEKSPKFYNDESVAEAKNGYIKSWVQIEAQLPDNFNSHHMSFVRDYFRAQLRIAKGKTTKARRIFMGLEKRKGYLEFEDANQPLLSAIDIAVRGITHRKDVEPSFDSENYEPNPKR